eukprot:CAMPEP_0194331442 /NCGR_PEP_ID=MMETSP0171-20130528/55575_1 /TAXON_ID=218684 /ORGANISM="Corethron pennatum, Strain L29A3" /LENGTH=33 /DNA_ID= /DNA_START= /DNA_END= /DNA_ORIENTATION=
MMVLQDIATLIPNQSSAAPSVACSTSVSVHTPA